MTPSYALLEAALSCGSPTCGTEFAYDALLRLGLSHVFPDARLFPMEKLPRCTAYPEHLKFLDTVMAANRALRENMLSALAEGRYPVVIGGDHSIAMGTLAALGEHYGAENTALVYVDAHTDINTERTSVSHFIHGMDLAAACGLCCGELQVGKNRVSILGQNIHILGARSIDPPERDILAAQRVDLRTADEIRARGLDAVLRNVLPQLSGKQVHISFDVDALDPTVFSATGYNIPGGLTRAQAEQILREVLPLSSSFECVEYNPTIDHDGRDGQLLAELLRLVPALTGQES